MNLHEHVLDHVFGLFRIAEQRKNGAVNAGLIALDEDAEGGFAPALQLRHQLGIPVS